MAFLPTMSLFLLAAVNAAEEAVVAETEVANVEEKEEVANMEEQEDEIADEPEQGVFKSCMEGTPWAAANAQSGHELTDSDTCESTFAFEECLTHPADGKNCCPHVCNSEHICKGESFENVSDDVDEASNAVTECLENFYEPSAFAFWTWGKTWRRTKFNSCDKVYKLGYTPETHISVALCCPNKEESPVADEDVSARMLAEDEADAEAEAEDEDEAEAEAEVVANARKHYGQELRDAMCVGGAVTTPTLAPVNPDAPDTKKPNTPGEDPKGSASTFGFTALALMLVTA